MNTKHILIAALLAGAVSPATARSLADSAEDNGGRRQLMIMAHAPIVQEFEHLDVNAPLMVMHVKSVKNAPYSAEVVSERTQTLSDGNLISDKSSTMNYRDSAGRTRQETRGAAGATKRVTIVDAVEGITYILNPEKKTVIKVGPHKREVARIAGEKARAQVEEMRKERGAAREAIIVKRIERADGDAGQRVRENVRIQVSKAMAEGQPMPGMDRFGPMLVGAFGDMKWSHKSSTKDLGTKEIDGVKAQGKLRSYEIPAGEIGNRNAIVVATETWYAPELQVVLLSKHSDPRTGERSYRLEGLKREEPAAALFSLPSDYTVKEPMGRAKKSTEANK